MNWVVSSDTPTIQNLASKKFPDLHPNLRSMVIAASVVAHARFVEPPVPEIAVINQQSVSVESEIDIWLEEHPSERIPEDEELDLYLDIPDFEVLL